MNIDAATVATKSHQYNQDYALPFYKDGINGVVVCDGCSGTPHSDVAARLLAFSFVDLIDNIFYNEHKVNVFYERKKDYEGHLINRILQDIDTDVFNIRISSVYENKTLNYTHIFDATTIVAAENGDNVLIKMYGDGALKIKQKNGTELFYKIEPCNGYPPYLFYLKNEERLAEFLKQENSEIEKTTIIRNTKLDINSVMVCADKMKWPSLNLKFKTEDLEYIMLCTDGVSSFPNTKWVEVVDELTNFKSLKGEFMQRRLKAMMKKYNKEGLYNADDLTVGIIHFGAEK